MVKTVKAFITPSDDESGGYHAGSSECDSDVGELEEDRGAFAE